jgi:hypothetical protein
MRKAGLEAGIARLARLCAAHMDYQLMICRSVAGAHHTIGRAEERIAAITQDVACLVPTRGAAFRMCAKFSPTPLAFNLRRALSIRIPSGRAACR